MVCHGPCQRNGGTHTYIIPTYVYKITYCVLCVYICSGSPRPVSHIQQNERAQTHQMI